MNTFMYQVFIGKASMGKWVRWIWYSYLCKFFYNTVH